MTTLTCLTLIIYMEGSNQSIFTQDLLASFALTTATRLDRTVCETISDKHTYSWSWNGDLRKRKVQLFKKKNLIKVSSVPGEQEALTQARLVAEHAIKREKIMNRTFFNNCSVGKKGRRFATDKSIVKSEKLCFY